jgi:hypothetical protein
MLRSQSSSSNLLTEQFTADISAPDPSHDLFIRFQTFLTQYGESLATHSHMTPRGSTATPVNTDDTPSPRPPSLPSFIHPNSDVARIQLPKDRADVSTRLSSCVRAQSTEKSAKIFTVIKILAALCEEIDRLYRIAHVEFFAPISCFGKDMSDPTQTLEIQFGRFLPILQNVYNYSQRCRDVMVNVMLQLAGLYFEKGSFYESGLRQVHMDSILSQLGKLLRVLLTLDLMIEGNTQIAQAWQAYKKMFKYVRVEPQTFSPELTPAHIEAMESLLYNIEMHVFNNSIFMSAINTKFESPNGQYPHDQEKGIVERSKLLCEEMFKRLNLMFENLAEGVQNPLEAFPRTSIVEIYALIAFHSRIYQHTFKLPSKNYKALWSLQQR